MKRGSRGYGLWFIVLWLFAPLTLAAPTASDALQQMLASMHSLRANFIQTVTNHHGQILQQANGYVLIDRPGKFRWEVKQPVAQIIVAVKQKLWIYDPDLEQVTLRSLEQAAGTTPALLLSDNNPNLLRQFKINQVDSQRFMLFPKDENSLLASITLTFVHGTLNQMLLKDHLGHVTHIQFEQVVLNQKIDSSNFQLSLSKNVDVIDASRASHGSI